MHVVITKPDLSQIPEQVETVVFIMPPDNPGTDTIRVPEVAVPAHLIRHLLSKGEVRIKRVEAEKHKIILQVGEMEVCIED